MRKQPVPHRTLTFKAILLSPFDKTIEWFIAHEKLQPSILQFDEFSNSISYLVTFSQLTTLHFTNLEFAKDLKSFNSIKELIVDLSLYLNPTEVFETLPNLEKLTLNGEIYGKPKNTTVR